MHGCSLKGKQFISELYDFLSNNPQIKEISIKKNKTIWDAQSVTRIFDVMRNFLLLKKIVFVRNDIVGKFDMTKILNLTFIGGIFKLYQKFNMKSINQAFEEKYLRLNPKINKFEIVDQKRIGKYKVGILSNSEYLFGFKTYKNKILGIYWELTPDIYSFNISSILSYFPEIKELKIYPNSSYEPLEISNSSFLNNLFTMISHKSTELRKFKIYSPISTPNLLDLFHALSSNKYIKIIHFTTNIYKKNEDLFSILEHLIFLKSFDYIYFTNVQMYSQNMSTFSYEENLKIINMGTRVRGKIILVGKNNLFLPMNTSPKYKGISPFYYKREKYMYKEFT